MNCYRHKDVVSLGICKSCMKGLCENCAVEVDQSLACKGYCENDVKVMVESQKNIPNLHKYAKAQRKYGPVFLILFGLYISIYWSGLFSSLQDYSLVGMGVISVAFGLVMAYRSISSVHNKNV